MAINRDALDKQIEVLKQQMDFHSAAEMNMLQDAVYKQYLKEMRESTMIDTKLWGSVTGRVQGNISNLGLTAEQASRQHRFSPDLGVLVTPSGRPIGPEWRGAAIVRVSLPNTAPSSDIAVAFRSREDNVEAMVYLQWDTPRDAVYKQATFYVELLNQWRVGEVSVSIEV
jgi:hypothetical protein